MTTTIRRARHPFLPPAWAATALLAWAQGALALQTPAVTDLQLKSTSEDGAVLEWTAPISSVATYMVFCREDPIPPDVLHSSSMPQLLSTVAAPVGTPLNCEIGDLPAGWRRYFAIVVYSRSASEISNVVWGRHDVIPPDPVTGLSAQGRNSRSLAVSWSETGDDGLVGTVAGYDLRWSLSPITEESFDDATAAGSIPPPVGPGNPMQVVISWLRPATVYHVAIRASDPMNNRSPVVAVAGMTLPETDGDSGGGGGGCGGAAGGRSAAGVLLAGGPVAAGLLVRRRPGRPGERSVR